MPFQTELINGGYDVAAIAKYFFFHDGDISGCTSISYKQDFIFIHEVGIKFIQRI